MSSDTGEQSDWPRFGDEDHVERWPAQWMLRDATGLISHLPGSEGVKELDPRYDQALYVPASQLAEAQKRINELLAALAWAIDWIECEGKPDGFDAATEPESWNEHFEASALLRKRSLPTPQSRQGANDIHAGADSPSASSTKGGDASHDSGRGTRPHVAGAGVEDGSGSDKHRWVNAVITFTVPLDVPIDASVGEKADAAQAIAEQHFPEMPDNAVGTIGFRDVENGEPLRPLPAEQSKLGELKRFVEEQQADAEQRMSDDGGTGFYGLHKEAAYAFKSVSTRINELLGADQ